jgi:hypothetical protein
MVEGMSLMGSSPYECTTYRNKRIIEKATFQALGEAMTACSARAKDEAEARRSGMGRRWLVVVKGERDGELFKMHSATKWCWLQHKGWSPQQDGETVKPQRLHTRGGSGGGASRDRPARQRRSR